MSGLDSLDSPPLPSIIYVEPRTQCGRGAGVPPWYIHHSKWPRQIKLKGICSCQPCGADSAQKEISCVRCWLSSMSVRHNIVVVGNVRVGGLVAGESQLCSVDRAPSGRQRTSSAVTGELPHQRHLGSCRLQPITARPQSRLQPITARPQSHSTGERI